MKKTLHLLLTALAATVALLAAPSATHAAPGDLAPLDPTLVGSYVFATAVQHASASRG